MNFFKQRLRLSVGRRERFSEYGGLSFLVCVCNKNSSTLAGIMQFNKNVCVFTAVFDREFVSQ